MWKCYIFQSKKEKKRKEEIHSGILYLTNRGNCDPHWTRTCSEKDGDNGQTWLSMYHKHVLLLFIIPKHAFSESRTLLPCKIGIIFVLPQQASDAVVKVDMVSMYHFICGRFLVLLRQHAFPYCSIKTSRHWKNFERTWLKYSQCHSIIPSLNYKNLKF